MAIKRIQKRGKVKPIERFPTNPRKDGRFVKRIRGRLYYFGTDGNRDAALLEYDRVKHALYEGRSPRPNPEDVAIVTAKEIAIRFRADKVADVRAGLLSQRTLDDYDRAIRRFLKFIGKGRIVADLTPDDFASYKRHLVGSKGLGPYAFNRERACVAAMFNHATDNDWIDRPVKLGKGFRKFGDDDLRAVRKSRLFTRDDVANLLAKAGPQMRAMILLGLNGGFGPTDVSGLPRERVVDGWVRYRRQKTKILRDVPLWPETIDALAPLLAKRPDDPLIFRTKYGRPWVRNTVKGGPDNAISKAFGKLAKDAGVSGSFYGLRHTHITYAKEAGMPDAQKRIVGHRQPGLDDTYIQTVFDHRLRTVADHVRARLLGEPGH